MHHRGKTVNLLRNDEPLTTDAPKSYHSERVMEMHLTANGSTEFRCWETIGGLLAMMIKGTYGATLVSVFSFYPLSFGMYVTMLDEVS